MKPERRNKKGANRVQGAAALDYALHLDLPLISRDGKIQLSGINTIW
jgi:hypothetical protein